MQTPQSLGLSALGKPVLEVVQKHVEKQKDERKDSKRMGLLHNKQKTK